MGLKFRRGSTAQQSGSLAFGEPYVNTTLGTLVVGGATGDIVLSSAGTGSTGNFGAISGSGLDITGNANVAGNVTIGGQLTIGDQTSDTVNVVAALSSSLIPQTTNAFDLGSATKIWRDLYISTGSIKFVEGNTVVKSLSAATLTALEVATGSSNVSVAALNSFTSSIDTTTKNKMNTDGVISGSSQITYASISSIPVGIVSGSSQTIANLPTGVVSGSAQTIANLPTGTVSGSSQITYANISSIPAGIVSGSSQIDITLTTGFSTYSTSVDSRITTEKGRVDAILSAADADKDTFVEIVALINSVDLTNDTAFASFYTASTGRLTSIEAATGSYETKGRGIVSGSSQITYASISSIPSGIVSGSSQVTGIGNAQLTNSSTTIGSTAIALGASSTTLAGLTSVSSTGFTGALTGNASTATTLETARTINGTSFNGSANITIANLVSGSAQIDGSQLGSNKTITIGSTSTTLGGTSTTLAGLTSVSSTGFTGALTGNASTATTLATARTINGTSFDGSANITIANLVSGSAQIDGSLLGSNKTITVGSTTITLGGSATTIAGLTSVTSTGFTGALTGNASTATTLQTARNINGVSFNGSADITVTAAAGTLSGATLASGVTASSLTSVGTLTSLTVSGATATGALTVTGAITATGDITAYYTSDKRHKNNIQTIPNALEKVTKLNGVTWEWNDDVNEVTKSTPKTGLIAQEVQEVLPEVVKTRDDGFLALDYSKMMGLLVEAIKEQQIQIEKLRMDLDNYECKCDNCKSK